MLAEHAAHLDDDVRARILHDNVAELYGITV
jgi:predicted TIM-barrel fold metal-dependent hydrolase